jgi:predicted transcriptional regulator of viral defense system
MSASPLFTTDQVDARYPGYNKTRLSKWVEKGRVIKLRNTIYTFPEFLHKPYFALWVANQMLKPSYISFHTALAFHGLIPETDVLFASVTTGRNSFTKNPLGTFSYKKTLNRIFFGYNSLALDGDVTLIMATAEKALIDILHFNPQLTTETDFLNLHLNEYLFKERINVELMQSFAGKFACIALSNRVSSLLKMFF